eukprot:TRINITY_DN3897_c0_g3_i1.p1 TRINITY_DN3897_c0_g3~~TRINITY_DN3897_c0_g3_i1.p1  ORF type:complete len:160 (+),score=36.79 TRINITY_DN3897_c0_g3_i1:319-798(+)
MNTIPNFGGHGTCRPYIQIFKNAKLIFSSTWQTKNIKAYNQEEGCVLFPVETPLDGDILVRIRHLTKNNNRISMLRFGFHTGFIRPGNFRLTKQELDGVDEKFADDFLLDLIFTPVVDEEGKEVSKGEFDERFWKTVTTRKVSALEAQKIAPKFSLFGE